jgi:hypothetical protein
MLTRNSGLVGNRCDATSQIVELIKTGGDNGEIHAPVITLSHALERRAFPRLLSGLLFFHGRFQYAFSL